MRRQKKPIRRKPVINFSKQLFRGLLGVCVLLTSACTIQSSISNRYLTAEKLWSEKNYQAAVTEFDKIVKENPNSAIALQSLWRASTTRTLFLNEQEGALQGFETFLEKASSSELAPQAQKEIGEIYFVKLAQYQKAIDQYEKLIQSKKFSPSDEAIFYYRTARSYFLLNRILKAIEFYDRLLSLYPKEPITIKGKLDLGNAWYTIGENDKGAYAKALTIFQNLATETKDKDKLIYEEALFGEASILEEQDQLEEAHQIFKSLETDYPAPNVIKIRVFRLEERLKKKRK
jgi:tetratricopeptide (TPR) repeat protein